jgi:two-component system, cell cycle sensor histidine kinase and response regulator CckA
MMSDTRVEEYRQAVPIAGAVLVIDDDEAIREALTDLLSLLTEAAVYTAANGHEGLQILQQRQNIALILLDMNMPVMNGEETYERVQEIAPETKVIISTSLSSDEVSVRLGERELPAFLQKPYDLLALMDVMQSVVTVGAS